MKGSSRSRPACCLAVLVGLAAALSAPAQDKVAAPAGSTVNVTVTSGTAPPPPVSITLHERHGQAVPHKKKHAHAGGGLIDVAAPTPDVVVVTMSGAVVATAEMTFDFEQCFEVSFDDPKVKKAKLTLEGRVVGLLRGECLGCADVRDAAASVSAADAGLVAVALPPHSACKCENVAINDHDGPHAVPVVPGKYTLHQTFAIAAQSKCCLCKRPSAEFAPDPAIDPLWINYWEPFHGVKKDTFGFQVTLKVAPETEEANGNGAKKPPDEALPPPMPAKP
jgi:hypothetical protein